MLRRRQLVFFDSVDRFEDKLIFFKRVPSHISLKFIKLKENDRTMYASIEFNPLKRPGYYAGRLDWKTKPVPALLIAEWYRAARISTGWSGQWGMEWTEQDIRTHTSSHSPFAPKQPAPPRWMKSGCRLQHHKTSRCVRSLWTFDVFAENIVS